MDEYCTSWRSLVLPMGLVFTLLVLLPVQAIPSEIHGPNPFGPHLPSWNHLHMDYHCLVDCLRVFCKTKIRHKLVASACQYGCRLCCIIAHDQLADDPHDP